MDVATKLEELLVNEVSLVDDPANKLPGWMVSKSASDTNAAAPAAPIVIHQHFGETPAADPQVDGEDATSLIGKLRSFLSGEPRKDEVEMTKEEFTAELDSALDARFAALTETLSKSVEAPAVEGESAPAVEEAPETPAVTAEAVPAITAEDVTKSVEEALQPYMEILDKTLDRIERIEEKLALRKSLDGQEEHVEKADNTPTLGDAFRAAFSGQKVTLS